jgi:RNA methyltransferase, TrmH family
MAPPVDAAKPGTRDPARCTHVSSRANAMFKDLKKLAHDSSAYRSQGRVWLEGEHLCQALLARGRSPSLAVVSESYWPQAQQIRALAAIEMIAIADDLWREISTLPSPAPMGFVLDLPPTALALQPAAPSVILDRLQDAGNVGSILRSAAAFGFGQIIAMKGTAALWSPKVLRAGMGAHFGLSLIEGVDPAFVDALQLPLLMTSSHRGESLHALARERRLPVPCAWVLGHEGQGVADALASRAGMQVRIEQPGGEESLNVAAAAAICLHASAAAGFEGR